jgi:hypothetical protein
VFGWWGTFARMMRGVDRGLRGFVPCGLLPGNSLLASNPPNNRGNGGSLDGVLGRNGILGRLFGIRGAFFLFTS